MDDVDFEHIVLVALILLAVASVISGIVKAKNARKNGRSKAAGIGAIALGIILAIMSVAGAIIMGRMMNNSGKYIKAQHPLGVPYITYGEVFDNVCSNQKWGLMDVGGDTIVQMNADYNYAGEVRGLKIQFRYGHSYVDEIYSDRLDSDTPFKITFVGLDDSTETPVLVMQDLIYEMFDYYAAGNGIELNASVKDTILYSEGWNGDGITSNRAEGTVGRTPQVNDVPDDEEYDPLFEEFSELMYQHTDFSGMNDEEIQSYIEKAYEQWLLGEAYDEIVFDENLELTYRADKAQNTTVQTQDEPQKAPQVTQLDSRYIKSIQASSELTDSTKTYQVETVLDGDKETCWSEGADGTGEGEFIYIEFTSPVYISEVAFLNGYMKNETVYNANGKIKSAELMFDEESYEVAFVDWQYQEVENSLYSDRFTLDTLVPTQSLTIMILEAQKGTKYDDICLTELGLWGYVDDMDGGW